MIWISSAQQATASGTRDRIPPSLVDDFVESYVCWREAAVAAKEAYEHWAGVDRDHQAAAFAAYRAALDGEEAAARDHRTCTERIAGGRNR
jgi:hypothetical protein